MCALVKKRGSKHQIRKHQIIRNIYNEVTIPIYSIKIDTIDKTADNRHQSIASVHQCCTHCYSSSI